MGDSVNDCQAFLAPYFTMALSICNGLVMRKIQKNFNAGNHPYTFEQYGGISTNPEDRIGNNNRFSPDRQMLATEVRNIWCRHHMVLRFLVYSPVYIDLRPQNPTSQSQDRAALFGQLFGKRQPVVDNNFVRNKLPMLSAACIVNH